MAAIRDREQYEARARLAKLQRSSEPADAALQVISGTAPEAINPPAGGGGDHE
jgi:hypothetical protein